jgi:hypothetical protein
MPIDRLNEERRDANYETVTTDTPRYTSALDIACIHMSIAFAHVEGLAIYLKIYQFD